MPVSVGTAFVDIRPDLSGFGRELNSGVDRASSSAGETASSGMAGGFKKAAGVLAGAFAGVQVAGFLKDSVAAATDLGESMSKVGVVFGDRAADIEKFASSAATSLGMSKQAALEATGTLGNLFSAMGLGKAETADLSTGMVTLASDLASFNNANPEETLLALRSGLLGEAEPLKRFGVNLNAARIEAEALAMGLVKPAVNAEKIAAARLKVEQATKGVLDAEKAFGKESAQAVEARAKQATAEEALTKAMEGTKVELTAAQKAQAAHSIIMKDTSLAQGDFARTSDGLANKQRILSAQFEDVKAKIGTALMPAALGLATFLSNNLGPAFEGISTVVRTVADFIGGLVERFRGGGESMGETGAKLSGVFESVKAVVESVFGALKAIFETFVAVATELWDRFGGTILSFVTEWGANLMEALRGVFNTVSGLFDLVKALLTGKWGEAWEAVKKIFDGIWDTLWAVIRNVFTNILPTVFGLAQAALSAAWSLLWNTLKTAFTDLWDGIYSTVTGAISGIVEFVKGLPGKIKDAASGMWDGIKDAFRSAINWIIRAWNGLKFEIPGWDPPGPGPVFGGFTIGVPTIPELAAGGSVVRGGAALVGERGAELLELPRGARVRPLERDLELEPAGGRGPVIGEFNLNGSDLSAWDVADEIGWLMRTTGR